MICALIQNDLVVGVCDFTDEQVERFAPYFEQVVDITNMSPAPQIGWAFDGQNIVGSNVSKKITRLAMRQRFTVGELLAIMTYVNSNPSSIVAMLMKNLEIATFVDLSRSDTQAGIGVLVAYGLITSARAAVILTTTPSPLEIYTG